MSTDFLLEALGTLPPELLHTVYDYVQSPSTPAEHLKLLPLSRKHYDTFILSLYRKVTLKASNAERFLYGLGDRFGCSAPTKAEHEALEEQARQRYMTEHEERVQQGIVRPDLDAILDMPPGELDEEEYDRRTVIYRNMKRERELKDSLLYIQHDKYTSPYERKFHLINSVVVHLFIEDCQALTAIAEASNVIDEASETGLKLSSRQGLFGNLLSMSLGPALIERYDKAQFPWETLLGDTIEHSTPQHICVRLPAQPARLIKGTKTIHSLISTIDGCLHWNQDRDEEYKVLRSFTMHNVNLNHFYHRTRHIAAVSNVRFFLRTDIDADGLRLKAKYDHGESEANEDENHDAVVSDIQHILVERDLELLGRESIEYSLQHKDGEDFAWGSPDYLNFLPAEANDFDPETDFVFDYDIRSSSDSVTENYLFNDDTGRGASFYGRGQGEACGVCKGR